MKTIGPNPTLIGLEFRERPQAQGESDLHYIKAQGRYARRQLARLLTLPEYRYSHKSFAVRDAMLLAEAAFTSRRTFGVEHIPHGSNQRSPAIDYLNAGDTYDLTLLYVRGQFRAGCWGDIVERGNYA